MVYQQSTAADVMAPSASILGTKPWREHSIAAYRKSRSQQGSDIRGHLVSLLLSLTGPEATTESIWADDSGRTAVARIDGHTFHLGDGKLSLLRPCNYCGVSQFESPGIRTVEDLGRALSWEPCCEGCEPDDEDWSYSW